MPLLLVFCNTTKKRRLICHKFKKVKGGGWQYWNVAAVKKRLPGSGLVMDASPRW